MRRFLMLLAVAVPVGFTFSLTGCGAGHEDGTVTQSPEAKKADEGGQKAMEDYMKSKGKGAPKK